MVKNWCNVLSMEGVTVCTFCLLTSYSYFQTDQNFQQFMTVKPSLTFIELRVVSMEHLQRMGNASRERFPCGHLVPSPFWELAYAPIVETSFTELAVSLLEFSPWIPFGTFSILLCIALVYYYASYSRHIGHDYLKANMN